MKLKLFIAFVMIGALFCAVKIGAQPGHGESTPTPVVQFRQALQPMVDCTRLRSRVDANASETYDETKFYKTKIKSYQTFLQESTRLERWGPAGFPVVARYVQCKFEFENCGITGIVNCDPNEAFVVTDERERFLALAGNLNAVKLCDTIKTAFATNKYVKLWYYYFGTANSIGVYSAELVNE